MPRQVNPIRVQPYCDPADRHCNVCAVVVTMCTAVLAITRLALQYFTIARSASDATLCAADSESDTVSGVITLDTSSVSTSCSSQSLYQCVQSYKINGSDSLFTLTTTSSSSSACGVGQGKQIQALDKHNHMQCCQLVRHVLVASEISYLVILQALSEHCPV